MSAIIARVKADSITARKAKNTVVGGVLTTLLGEIATKEKTFNPARPMTDEEVVAVVQKFLKSNAESLALVDRIPAEKRDAEHAKILAEKAALEVYLPQQMSEDELRAIAIEQRDAGSNLGQIMSFLKTNYAGRYDGKTASAIVKSVIG